MSLQTPFIFQILLSLFFSLFKYRSTITQENTFIFNECPLYSFHPLPEPQCLKLKPNFIALQQCPINTKCIMNELETEGKCIKSETVFDKPSYPGGKCLKNEDCISSKCVNNKCSGAKLSEKCSTSTECLFGLSCLNNICMHPKPMNTKCEKTSDCKYPYMCYNGRCKDLFVFNNGYEINNSTVQGYNFLCKSGRIYNGYCNQFKLVNEFCDDSSGNIWPCKYQNILNQTTKSYSKLNSVSTCRCEFNSDTNRIGRHRCLWGDADNQEWKWVLSIINKTRWDNNTQFCNNDEERPGYCREVWKTNYNARRENTLWQRYLIESDYKTHFLPKDSELVLNTIFGLDIISDLITGNDEKNKTKFQCPHYLSSPLDNNYTFNKICAYGINPFNEQGNNITIFVHPEPCPFGYKCDFDSNAIYSKWTYNATCKFTSFIDIYNNNYNNYPNIKSKEILSFPGEDCRSDNNCWKGSFDDIGKCDNYTFTCSGRDFKDKCWRHSDCKINLFCNLTSHQCEYQKYHGEFCNNWYECQNNLLCMNHTCYKRHSLTNGTTIPSKDFRSLCKYNYINEESLQCIDSLEPFNSTVDENGFVKCHIGDKCNYTSGADNTTVYTMNCECGYNENGTAFCPLSHSFRKNEWKKYFKLRSEALDWYKCHTWNRGSCINEDVVRDIEYYKMRTEKANLFYMSTKEIIETLKGKRWSVMYRVLLMIVVVLYF